MLLGHFTMPHDSSLPGEPIVVCGYLIAHPEGQILFDTGLEAAHDWEYTNPNVVDFDGVRLEVHEGEADVAREVRIIPTPGHTPGHQSLVVETRRGRVVLAGQAGVDPQAVLTCNIHRHDNTRYEARAAQT